MSEVQRYICEGDRHSAEMVPCAFGGWVSYEDYTESLAAARREIETVTRSRDGWERRTKEISSVLLRAWEVLRKWWQFSKLEEREEPFAIALARAIAEDAGHDAYVLSEMRRLHVVIETVTRERDEAKDFLASYRGTFTREKERADKAEADLATARAALEDVRSILRTIADMWDDEKAMHEIAPTAYEMSNMARRALAQNHTNQPE